jgi:hypothetical protein
MWGEQTDNKYSPKKETFSPITTPTIKTFNKAALKRTSTWS